MSAASLQRLDFIMRLTDQMSAPASKIMKTMDKVTHQVQAGVKQIGFGAAGLVGVGFAVDRLISKAVKFESVMADVNKTVDFGAENGLANFSAKLLSMTKILPITAEGLGEIAAAGGRLGLKEVQLPDFVNVTAKMATAFDLQTEMAGDYAANLSNIYKIPIDKLSLLGDAVNHLSDNTAAKAGDILDVLQRTGGVGQQFGLSANQIAAMSAQMLALGVPAEQSATSMNALFIRLQNLQMAGPKVQGVLNSMGLTAKQFAADVVNNPQAAINGFLERIQGLDSQQQSIALSTIFGLEHAPKLALLAGSFEQYGKALGLVANQQGFMGSMEKEFLVRSKTTANQLILLGNGWDRLMISFGSVLLPAVINAVGALNSVIDPVAEKMARWSELFPNLSRWVGYLAGTLVGTIAIISTLSIVMGVSKFMMAGWTVVATLTKLTMVPFVGLLKAMRWGWLVFNSALVAGKGILAALRVGIAATWSVMHLNPISLIVGGVALLMFGLYKLGQHFGVFDYLKQKVVALKQFFDDFDLLGTLMGSLDWLINKINLIPGISINTADAPKPVSAPAGLNSTDKGRFAGGGLINQITNASANNSRSIGDVHVNNYGQAMNGQALADELAFAG